MQPSIFGKNLDSVEFSDIVAFCAQQPKEGLSLDYKKDLSSVTGVVKALVSFANTNGGWQLIGVEDDGNDAPKLPVTGMDYENNFEQRINNSIISSVTPIILPSYRVCKSPDGDKAFLIAYMPQSASAPHWMQYKSKNTLFVRLADRALGQEWEDYASIPQWEMLRDRRQASVNLSKHLLQLMKWVFVASANIEEDLALDSARITALAGSSRRSADRHYRRTQTITLQPRYPNLQVSDIETVEHAITSEPVSNGIISHRAQTPETQGYTTKVYQSGAYSLHREDAIEKSYFFGLDVYGNVMNVDPVIFIKRQPPPRETVVFTELSLLITNIVGLLKFANNHYAKIGLVGSLAFHVEFDASEKCLMLFTGTGLARSHSSTAKLPENVTGYYSIERDIDTNVISDTDARNHFVLGVAKEILYSFNYSQIDEDSLLTLIKRADGTT